MLREGHCPLDGVSTSGGRVRVESGKTGKLGNISCFAGGSGFGWKALDLAGGRWCVRSRALI